jgi:hypothetical protein
VETALGRGEGVVEVRTVGMRNGAKHALVVRVDDGSTIGGLPFTADVKFQFGI